MADVSGPVGEGDAPGIQHRRASPIINVQTSPSGDDALDPRVAVVPRSVWGATETGRTVFAPRFDAAPFDPEKEFFVHLEARHPGSESWPLDTVLEMFFAHPTGMSMGDHFAKQLVTQSLLSAASWDEKIAAVAQAEAYLETSPSHPGGLQGSSAFAAHVRTLRNNTDAVRGVDAMMDTRVRLTGLGGASAHLNGHEGLVHGVDPSSYDANSSATSATSLRFCVRLEDGREVREAIITSSVAPPRTKCNASSHVSLAHLA